MGKLAFELYEKLKSFIGAENCGENREKMITLIRQVLPEVTREEAGTVATGILERWSNEQAKEEPEAQGQEETPGWGDERAPEGGSLAEGVFRFAARRKPDAGGGRN